MKILINNKKAYFNFTIIDEKEAGIHLYGWEVKSVKNSKIDISAAFIKELKGELYLSNAVIYPWKGSQVFSKNELNRDRKLLMHKSQISQMASKAKQVGFTLVPLQIYENNNKLIKVSVGLVQGKKKFDKRQVVKERDLKRRIDLDRKNFGF